MKLWLIQRIGETYYDEHAGFVVRASDENSAREVAGAIDNEHESWTCDELTEDGDEEIILTDFRAG